jgi:Txe/YoeB family toxin of Txe-Axe toxin-antitoxin module
MERIMEEVCDDVKEAKEVKKKANEIIKEIARNAESPWETEYFEDKNVHGNTK